MKKLISILCVTVMLLTTVAGCVKPGTLEGLNGREAASILLARERLQSHLLKTEDNIFSSGEGVYKDLAETAMRNFVNGKNTVLDNVDKLASDKDSVGGSAQVDGDTFTWNSFGEISNSAGYFENITTVITGMANNAADCIDDVKKNVRIVDRWINYGDTSLYLHVEKNSETLYRKHDTYIEICSRYKNSNGQNVYEYYQSNEIVNIRTLYIPGVKYELTESPKDRSLGDLFFVADNTKGFWETLVVSGANNYTTVSELILKNDLCYDVIYDIDMDYVCRLNVISADRKTDLFIINNNPQGYVNDVEFKLNGINGIKNIQVKASGSSVAYDHNSIGPDTVVYYDKNGEGSFHLSNSETAVVNLQNGKSLKVGDTVASGKASLYHMVASKSAYGYEGTVAFKFNNELTAAQAVECINEILRETGITFRRDSSAVISGLNRAYYEMNSVINCRLWNSYHVNDKNSIKKAVNAELAKVKQLSDSYEAIKNAPVIDRSDAKQIKMNAQFAPVTSVVAEGGEYDALKAKFNNVSLTVNDLLLFVVDEPYVVAFALANANGDLTLIDSTEVPSVAFKGNGDKFTVSTGAVELDIPVMEQGEYQLVAYLATADGVRSSGFIAVPFESVEGNAIKKDAMSIQPKYIDNDAISIMYSRNVDINIEVKSDVELGYEEFADLVLTRIYDYGTPDTVIYAWDGTTATALNGNEAKISYGSYRVAYSIKNGDVSVDGYVYVEFGA